MTGWLGDLGWSLLLAAVAVALLYAAAWPILVLFEEVVP